MKIGITCDLRDTYLAEGYGPEEVAEFDSVQTIEAIESALKAQGHGADCIGNIRQLVTRLANGDRWDLVFNIAEGMHGSGREAQVPALLDAYRIPYVFSGPLVMGLTLDKSLAKRVVRDHGIPTAPFDVVRGMDDISRITLPFPLFVKPLAEGTGKGISSASRVMDRDALRAVCERTLETYRQPALVETFLPGREFTVGIIGTGARAEIIGVMEIKLRGGAEPWCYSYENKDQWEDRVDYALADDSEAWQAAEVALAAWRALGCRDGGRLDLRSDTYGTPHFLEANPLAGIHPVVGDLVILSRLAGISYDALIGRMVDSALSDAARFPNASIKDTAYA